MRGGTLRRSRDSRTLALLAGTQNPQTAPGASRGNPGVLVIPADGRGGTAPLFRSAGNRLFGVAALVHNVEQAATLKLCVMDEAWRFIQKPPLRACVKEALKTWRKRNADMLINPALVRAKYRDLFH